MKTDDLIGKEIIINYHNGLTTKVKIKGYLDKDRYFVQDESGSEWVERIKI